MLRSNKFIVLTIVTVLAAIAAVIISNQNTPVQSLEKQLLFAELLEQVNDANRIKIQNQDNSIRLVKDSGTWVVQEADNYPANFGKIRQTLISLAELRIDSAKTKNPENFASLGVEDPDNDGADSTLLTVVDSTNRVLVSLIVGNTRKSSSASTNPGLYARLPEQQQALLVNGVVDISTTPSDWINAELMDIRVDRIKQVEFIRPDTTIQLLREEPEGDFQLTDIPEGKKVISEYTLNRQEDMLAALRITSVQSADNFSFADDAVVTSVSTYDGLKITIQSTSVDDTNYASFEFSMAADSVLDETEGEAIQNEIETLNQITNGWVYEVPDYKYELLVRNHDDLVDDIEPETEAVAE